MAFTIGHFVQLVFKVFRFDVSKIEHRFIDEDIKLIIDILSKKEKDSETNLR